jgi:hypothetical protein
LCDHVVKLTQAEVTCAAAETATQAIHRMIDHLALASQWVGSAFRSQLQPPDAQGRRLSNFVLDVLGEHVDHGAYAVPVVHGQNPLVHGLEAR